MEIIRNRRQGKIKTKRIKCKNCKSVLRVNYMDLHKHWNAADVLTFYYCSCPCCHQRIELSLRQARRII